MKVELWGTEYGPSNLVAVDDRVCTLRDDDGNHWKRDQPGHRNWYGRVNGEEVCIRIDRALLQRTAFTVVAVFGDDR